MRRMRLESARPTEFNSLNGSSFDAIIVASGYEARAPQVAEKTQGVTAGSRIALGFRDRRDALARPANDTKVESLGYRLVIADGNKHDEIDSVLTDLISDAGNGDVSLLVDYSSMTRVWYSAIIRRFALLRSGPRRARLVFAYSPSKYEKPPGSHDRPNAFMEPLEGFSGLQLPDRPIALVIGLGYEEHKGLGLAEYVDAWQNTYAFYTEPGSASGFVAKVKKNNADLLDRLDDDRKFPYPFDDLALTGMLLNSLVSRLVLDNRVILAPLGPKPFCLLSLLLGVRERAVDVWRVSSGTEGEPARREPRGDVLAYQVEFLRDD